MIIVLCGVRGSGKDTIGDIFVKNHGFQKEAFANPLKEMVKHAFPAFTEEDLYGPSKNRERGYREYPLTSCPWCGGGIVYDDHLLDPASPLGVKRCDTEPSHCPLPEFVSPRIALQTLGTEWGRRLYTNVWIDAAFEKISRQQQNLAAWASRLAVPKDYIGKQNFVITDGRFLNEVRRSKELGAIVVKLTRGLEGSTDTHASEAEFRTMADTEFDLVFYNANSALEELPTRVGILYERLKLIVEERQQKEIP